MAVVFSTLSPIEMRPVTGASPDMERLVAYMAAGLTFGLGYPKHRLHILLFLLCLIAPLEVAQNYIPGRHGHLPDAIFKAAGALVGIASAILIACWKRVSQPAQKL